VHSLTNCSTPRGQYHIYIILSYIYIDFHGTISYLHYFKLYLHYFLQKKEAEVVSREEDSFSIIFVRENEVCMQFGISFSSNCGLTQVSPKHGVNLYLGTAIRVYKTKDIMTKGRAYFNS